MRTGNVLFSAVHFFVVLTVMALGGVCVAVAKIPLVQASLSYFISTHPEVFFPIGIAAFVLSVILLVGLYAMNRKQYLQVVMQSRNTSVDESLIGKYVSKYWQGLFPDYNYTAKVLVHPNQKIEVIAEIPQMEEDEQIELLERVEGELGSLFAKHLGYDREFNLTVVLK
jgi:hypothetical protein